MRIGLIADTHMPGSIQDLWPQVFTSFNQVECILHAGDLHHLVAIVDGGPKLILFVVDGVLCDGGEQRQFGWGRFSPNLRHANGNGTWQVSPNVQSLRVYERALRVSEAIANHRAGMAHTHGALP